MKYIALIILTYTLLFNSLYANLSDTTFIPRIVNDAGALYTKPLEWDKKSFLTFSAIGIGTIISMTYDNEILHKIQDIKLTDNKKVLSISNTLGQEFPPIFALGVTSLGFATGDEKIKNLGYELIESYLITGNIVITAKYAFGRARPYKNRGSNNFNPFYTLNNDYASFPSGHVAGIFSILWILSARTNNNYYKSLILLPGFLTANERMYDNKHWFSDVFASFWLSYFIADYIVDRNNKSIKFTTSPSGFGIKFNF